jgi:hypothetical protein
MPVDPNIILGFKTPQFDNPLDVASRAMTMKHLSQQTQMADQAMADQQAVKSAFQSATTAGPDGKPSINRKAVLTDLYKTSPQKAMDLQKLFQTQDMEEMQRHTSAAKQLSWEATPENWGQIRQKAQEMGLPNADQLPENYMDSFVKNWQMHTLGGEEQLRQMNSERDYKRQTTKDAQDYSLAQQKLGLQKKLADARLQKSNKPKELTVGQAKQQGLYEQGIEAEKQFQAATKKEDGIVGWWNKYDPTSNLQWIDKNDWAPNWMKSEKAQSAQSSQDRWIEAFLRDASGAAIPPSERGAYAKDFFPMAGDSKQVVEDKARARQLKMETAHKAAGAALDNLHQSSDEEIDRLYRELGGE